MKMSGEDVHGVRVRVGKGARCVVTALVQVSCFTHADSPRSQVKEGMAAGLHRGWG